MSAHGWFVEHRTDYVIRSLEPPEAGAFDEHLAGCPECRAAIMAIERDLAWLAMGVRPVAPRPGLTRALTEAALGRRRRIWLAPAALAASVLLSLAAWGWAWWRTSGVEQSAANRIEQLARELANARDTLAVLRRASRVAQASIRTGRQEGGLIIFDDQRTHRWNVVFYGLPPVKPGEVCQFWFITEGGMERSVEVKMDGGATVLYTLTMPPSGARVMGAALTVEPAGSVAPAPRGKTLAHLIL